MGSANIDANVSDELFITVFNETCLLRFKNEEIYKRDVYLLNNMGQVVYSGSSKRGDVTISLAGLDTGIYRCCVNYGSTTYSKSFAFLKEWILVLNDSKLSAT